MLTIMERKKGESARDYVTRVLIDNIVNVHLEPGEKLLENDLSGQLGVSRTPYREAVLALAERQLVHIRPKLGENQMGTMPLCRFMRARAVRSPVTGQQCFTACIHVGQMTRDTAWKCWTPWTERKQASSP